MTRFNSNLNSIETQEPTEGDPSVLIVHNNQFMARYLPLMLGEIGFVVTVAPDGLTAMKILPQQPVDFVVLGQFLPDMDGLEFYKKLQAKAATKNIPVLFVWFWGEETTYQQAIRLGIRHFLSQPFAIDELLSVILVLLVESAVRNAK